MGLMTIERHGKAQVARALLFKPHERVRIRKRIGANIEGEIIAAEFSLVADARTDPPYGGMEEEESFGDGLQDVPKEIGAAHMSQLVGEYDFKFVGAE
jgi:hypothetical protein